MIVANGTSGAASVSHAPLSSQQPQLVGQPIGQQHVVDATFDAQRLESSGLQRGPASRVVLCSRAKRSGD